MQLPPGLLHSVEETLEELVGLLRRGTFVLTDHAALETERLLIIDGANEYLRPRLGAIDAPVVTAIVGPTGTGKSTIVNSLAQDMISATGVLRPTTKTPVLWAHRGRAGSQWTNFIARAQERVGSSLELIAGHDPMTADVTLIDTPPIDFTNETGSFTVRDVLEISDICIFVTSPARYADAIGWDFVAEARARGVPTLFVLNRLPADGEIADSLLADLARRLHEHELLLEPDASMIFPVYEGITAWHHGLEAGAVGHIRKELGELADTEFRGALMTQTALTTAVALAERARALGPPLDREAAAHAELRRIAAETYGEQVTLLEGDLISGSFADVTHRDVWLQAAADLAGVVTRRAGVAAQATAARWSKLPLGFWYLEHDGQSLWRHGENTAGDTGSALEEFVDEAVDMAGRWSRRGSLRAATARVSSDLVWRMALDPDRRPTRSLRRRFGEGLDGYVTEMRRRLIEILTELVRADGRRFFEQIGDQMPIDLGERVASAAERLLTVARSAVPDEVDGEADDRRA